MAKSKYIAPEYPTDKVFGAAVAAQRFNGGKYFKEDNFTIDEATYEKTVHFLANKRVIRDFLNGTLPITDEDMALGEEIRGHFRGLSFKVLRGDKINDFEMNAYNIAESNVVVGNLYLAIASCLPSCYERAKVRAATNARLNMANGGNIGTIGERLVLEIEVVRSIFSENFNTFIVTGMNDRDQSVYFFYRRKLDVGTKLKIRGTVKKHDANSVTKLGCVKEV